MHTFACQEFVHIKPDVNAHTKKILLNQDTDVISVKNFNFQLSKLHKLKVYEKHRFGVNSIPTIAFMIYLLI